MLQENNRTEFKAELNDKLEKEVVAFLNNREGGVLYIGLSGTWTGVKRKICKFVGITYAGWKVQLYRILIG